MSKPPRRAPPPPAPTLAEEVAVALGEALIGFVAKVAKRRARRQIRTWVRSRTR